MPDLYETLKAAVAASPPLLAALPGTLWRSVATDTKVTPYAVLNSRADFDTGTSTSIREKLEVRLLVVGPDVARISAAAEALAAPAPAGLAGLRFSYGGITGPVRCSGLVCATTTLVRSNVAIAGSVFPFAATVVFRCRTIRPRPAAA